MRERDILHEDGPYWVRAAAKGYEVYKTGITHSTRCATIGFTGAKGLRRAIDECSRRRAQDVRK